MLRMGWPSGRLVRTVVVVKCPSGIRSDAMCATAFALVTSNMFVRPVGIKIRGTRLGSCWLPADPLRLCLSGDPGPPECHWPQVLRGLRGGGLHQESVPRGDLRCHLQPGHNPAHPGKTATTHCIVALAAPLLVFSKMLPVTLIVSSWSQKVTGILLTPRGPLPAVVLLCVRAS
jgi:hypothetical protein